MDFGVTGKLGGYYLAEQYRKSVAGKSEGVGFAELAATKAAEKTESVSFKEMLKSKYPGAYYNVMDTSKIDGGLWGRNDYPWDAYFSEPADESVLGWTPSGAEPDMQSLEVHVKLNSMVGKIAIVIPPELEEKMKNNPELAKKVMERVDNFLLTNSTPGENEGFLMTFDENGEINHACVVGEGKFTVSSSEFVEARKAREAKHAEYERLAEEAALKRRLMEQETDARYYQSSITQKAVSVAAYEQIQDNNCPASDRHTDTFPVDSLREQHEQRPC